MSCEQQRIGTPTEMVCEKGKKKWVTYGFGFLVMGGEEIGVLVVVCDEIRIVGR